jgi:DNA polymerase-3 subunit delta'
LSFKDIRGEASAIAFLKNAVSAGRVASAYIFLGVSGCGKMLAAMNFAKLLNCAGPADGEPCEACASCVKINARSHPDVKIFEKEDGKSEFGIDVVLEAVRSITLKPYEARKKVFVIDDADMMSEEASNAVLKTLEEPPQDSILILIVEDIRSISQTIRSRSQTVKFFPMPVRDIEDILTREHRLPHDTAAILAGLSQGSIGKALRYSKNGFLEKRDRVIDGLRAGKLLDSDLEKAKRSELVEYLDIMLSWYRDVLVTKAYGAASGAPILNADRSREAAKDAASFSFAYLDKAVNAIADTRSDLDKNANTKLAMNVLGIRLEERG